MFKKLFTTSPSTTPNASPGPSRTSTPVQTEQNLLKYRMMIESLEDSGFLERHIEKQALNKVAKSQVETKYQVDVKTTIIN